VQYVRLAADLAILDIGLLFSSGFIDGGFVPFAASGTLIPRLHISVRVLLPHLYNAEFLEEPCYRDAVFCKWEQ